jgi:O-antigen/teichoic acid export membrane protein
VYWEGLKVVPILLLANVFLGIYYNQSIWYKLSGRTSFGAYIAIGGALLTVVINVLFIPEYGYMASAWATLVVYAAQMIASYMLGQRFYPIKYNQRKFALYIGGAVLIYFLCQSIDLQTAASRFIVHCEERPNQHVNLLIVLLITPKNLEKPALSFLYL